MFKLQIFSGCHTSIYLKIIYAFLVVYYYSCLHRHNVMLMTSAPSANQNTWIHSCLSLQVKSQLVFIRDSLELISDLYLQNNFSSVPWDTVKTEHFLMGIHRQIEELSTCVSRQKDTLTHFSSSLQLILRVLLVLTLEVTYHPLDFQKQITWLLTLLLPLQLTCQLLSMLHFQLISAVWLQQMLNSALTVKLKHQHLSVFLFQVQL